MKWYLKLGIIYIFQVFLRVFYLVPINKKRILFSSYGGMTYICNPKFIYEYLADHYGSRYEYIWVIKNNCLIPSNRKVKTVRPLSFKHLYYLMTSKVVIANVGIEPFVPPRKGRIFINTWHGGGAYKKGGLSATYYTKPHRFYFKSIRNLRSKSTTYLISSNRRFSEIFEKEFRLTSEKILPIGMPRNDIFFYSEEKKKEIRKEICTKYGINEDSIIVLYAPTYRGHESTCKHIDWTIDSDAISKAIKDRFGKNPILLYRAHENVIKDKQNVENSIDVTDYPEMQNLLISTDILISDYSSLIWDYSLSFKPGFLYTPDLKEYSEVTKLHTPIEQWQFPYSQSTEELCEQIINYDESKAIKKIKDHHELLGSYEKGCALKSIVDLIVYSMENQ